MKKQLFGERPLHGIIASVAFPLLAVVIIGSYSAWWMHKVSRVAGDAVGTGLVVLGVIPVRQPEPHEWPVVVRSSKADFGVMPDAEAAGDLADYAQAVGEKGSSGHATRVAKVVR